VDRRVEPAVDRVALVGARACALPSHAGKLFDRSTGAAGRNFFAVADHRDEAFPLYVARYDRYNPTYLALASIIVLLTWMYLTCLLLLLGGKLNAIIGRDVRRCASPSLSRPRPRRHSPDRRIRKS